MTQSHEFKFDLDQSYLGPLLDGCKSVLSRWPVRAETSVARVYRTDEEAAQALAARQAIRATMERMLNGSLSYLEGSRIVARTRFDADLEWDPDILPFVGAASETEALPIGDERKFWSAAALEGLQPKIIEAEGWEKGLLETHCRNFIRRFVPPEE